MKLKAVKENSHGNNMPKSQEKAILLDITAEKEKWEKKFLLVSVWLCQHRCMIQ